MSGSTRFATQPASVNPRDAMASARQQRMADAAEPHADDQHDRQIQRDSEIGGVLRVVERHAKTADAFHHDDIGLRSRASACASTMRSMSSATFSRAAAICGAIGSFIRYGVRIVGGQRDVRGGIELIGVFVVQHAVANECAGRDRLHRGGAQALRAKPCSNADETSVLPISVSVPATNRDKGVHERCSLNVSRHRGARGRPR